MTPRSKREYVAAVFLRYKHARRSDKGRIFDEFCTTCGYHRKYAIRLLRHQTPVGTNPWDQRRPGFLEADTVAHCRQSMAGQLAYTIDCVDIATGWSEQRAVWGRGGTGMLEQMRHIEDALPFALLGFDCDNGSEFLNHHLLHHFLNRPKPVHFTRFRAFRKDDNAHIEQKNWTHVRQWIGSERLDEPQVVELLNELYGNEWRLFHNFFCPSVNLLS